MKIAVVSKSNARGGGASRFAEDLTGWLRGVGCEATHFLAHPSSNLRSFQQPLYGRSVSERIALKAHALVGRYGLKEWLPLDGWWSLKRRLADFDIVHFHDHYSAFSALGMRVASDLRPCLFTAHDCLHFTGGCLYPRGCERFLDHCGSCPQKAFVGRFDFTTFNRKQNVNVAAKSQIQYIYPSQWLMWRAARVLVYRHPPIHIPYGFDSAPYGFAARHQARNQLHLAAGRPIVVVSAHDLADKRKGGLFALAAIRSIADLNPVVVFVGRPWRVSPDLPTSVSVISTGYLTHKKDLGRWYSAADVFLFPTLEDNLPISVQESMAAGTPVVGFATGGVPEMVQHGTNGWLVETGDQEALNLALRSALTGDMNLQAWGQLAKLHILENFSVKECVRRHLEVYQTHRRRFAERQGDVPEIVKTG